MTVMHFLWWLIICSRGKNGHNVKYGFWSKIWPWRSSSMNLKIKRDINQAASHLLSAFGCRLTMSYFLKAQMFSLQKCFEVMWIYHKTSIISHLYRHCWSLRCSWSIACWSCSNYIFIPDLMASMAQTMATAKRDEKHWSSEIWCTYIRDFMVYAHVHKHNTWTVMVQWYILKTYHK